MDPHDVEPVRPGRFLESLRIRAVYLCLAVAVIFIGLCSRRYREQLPYVVAEYSGDTLWALMVFLLISTIFVRSSLLSRGLIAFAFSVLIEISQLYHAPWIDAIRQTRLGGLVLGFGFLWSDLVCYFVGILIGVFIESLTSRSRPLRA